MQVPTGSFDWRAFKARAFIILSFSILLLFSLFTAPAGAITRNQVLSRAMSWVRHRVPYSQHRYYAGYRRDCSGFVSMAWMLGSSYSSRTISSRAVRVPIAKLKRGDAVLERGRHVALFGGWVNKRNRTYVAIEETTWGDHVRKHVRRIPRRAIGIRRRGILDRPRVLLASRISPTATSAHPVLVAVLLPTASSAPTLTVDGASVESSASASTTDVASLATTVVPDPTLLLGSLDTSATGTTSVQSVIVPTLAMVAGPQL